MSSQDEDKPKPKRQRRAKSAPSELPAVEDADGPKAEGEEAPKKKRRAKGPDPDAFGALLFSCCSLESCDCISPREIQLHCQACQCAETGNLALPSDM